MHVHNIYFNPLQRLYRADQIKNVITVVNENENKCQEMYTWPSISNLSNKIDCVQFPIVIRISHE